MYPKIILATLFLSLFFGCSSRTAATNSYQQQEIQEGEYWHSYKPSLKMKENLEERQEMPEQTK